jgi:hypothetical protein
MNREEWRKHLKEAKAFCELKCRWWWWFIEYSAWGMWRWFRHFLAQLDAHHDCFKSS